MNTEAITGRSMFGMHKGTQGIHLRLRLTACDKNFFFFNETYVIVFVISGVYVLFVGSTPTGLSFCTTRSFDKIDNNNNNFPFDVGNLDHETIGMDLLHCLCGSY